VRGRSAFVHRADLPGGVSLYELPDAASLFYWADCVIHVDDMDAVIDTLQAGPPDRVSERTAVVMGRGGITAAGADGAGDVVEIESASRDRYELRVASPEGGMLVFNQTHDPGWHAYLDGREQPIRIVNAVVQGVEVSPGSHRVRWVYRPAGLAAGVLLTLVGLGLFGAGAATCRAWNVYK